MVEQITNTSGAETLNTELDLQGINEPMDALGSFNLQEMEQDNTGPGDPPGKKKPVTMADLDKGYQLQMQQLKQLATYDIPKMADESRNQFQAARVVEFDAKKMNIDRYLGYGKSTFNKVGFSPFVDNEKNFNQNTNIWQDYGRMLTVFPGLAFEGGVSGYRSLGSVFSGDNFFTPDDQTAENFAELQNIGMSTKGGVGGFVNNFALNSAYTVGVGLSILAEEAVMFGATLATKGATSGFAAMRTAANIGRFGRAVNQAFKVNAVGNMLKGSTQLIKSLSKVGDAKDFYAAAKTGAYTATKGTLQFINPFTRTADDVIDMVRGSASVRNVSNLAKAKQTFGSFYRDVRDNNLALSESKLEGGSAKIDKTNELLSKYEEENGRPAEGEDLERIYQQAEDTGYGVTAINFPMILMTNRVVLDGLFKFRGLKTLDEAAEMANKGIAFKKGTGFYDALADGWVKNTAKSFLNPKAYLGRGVSYFRRNLAEGIQENLQNVTSDAVSSYYDSVYKDPTLGGFEFAMGNTWNALSKEFTSARGLETFASGFLMGGFMGKAQNLFLKDVPGIYYQVARPKKYAEYKLNKKQSRQDAIAGANELYNNPLTYFSSRNESAVIQKNTSDVMNQAEDAGDVKTFQDAKDLKMFDHIFTALDNRSYETLLNSYKELSKLDNKELANFLGLEETDKAPEKLQEVITRAEEIKSRYETINKQFKNPFNPNKLKKGSPEFTKEAIAFRAFENAKKTAISSQYGFDRALQRMNGLYTDIATNIPVSKSSSSDYTVLTDIEVLDSEISLLSKEVQSYKGATAEEQKKLGQQKQDRLDRLMDFRDKLSNHLNKAATTEKEDNGQIVIQFAEDTVDPLKESYKSYLREIAKINNDYSFDDKIDDSFDKLLDYYQLNQDARNYNKVVNTLLDPANLYRHAERLNAKFTDLFENKSADVNERVERAQRMFGEIPEMLKALSAQGVMLDPAELEEFVRTGKKPTTLIDAATLNDLDPKSPKFAAAQAILEIDNSITEPEIKTPAVEAADTTTEAATQSASATPAKVESIDAGIEPELQLKLEDAYNQYLEETESDISFDEFVKSVPRAARIKAEFNKGKAPAAETRAGVLQPDTSVQAQAAGTTRTQPVTTSTSQSSAESKKEKLREDTGFTNRAYSNEVLKQLGLPTGGEGGALTSWKGHMFTASQFKNSKVYQDNKEKIDRYLKKDGINTVDETDGFEVIPTFYDGVPRVQIAAKYNGVLNSMGSVEVSVNDTAYKLGKEKTEAEEKYMAEERAPVPTDTKAEIEKLEKELFEKNISLENWTSVEHGKYVTLLDLRGDVEKRDLLRNLEPSASWQLYAIETLSEKEAEEVLKGIQQIGTDAKADIEKRRQEEFRQLADIGVKGSGVTEKQARDNINKRYDAELAKELYKEMKAGKMVTEMTPAEQQVADKYITPELRASVDAELAALEGKPASASTTSVETVPTTTETTGTQKAQKLIDSISSIRDLPDLSKADSGPITIDLIELISTGEAKSKNIIEMLANKRKELLQNISTKDLQKGDIVTFVDGKKGFVKSVKSNEVSIKMTGSPTGVVDIIAAKDLSQLISNIEPGKLVSMEPTPDIEVTAAEETEVKASQDAKSSFTENSAAVKEVGDNAAKVAGTDNLQNLNNLIQNIGCKTGK
jgi:hypothetical protein